MSEWKHFPRDEFEDIEEYWQFSLSPFVITLLRTDLGFHTQIESLGNENVTEMMLLVRADTLECAQERALDYAHRFFAKKSNEAYAAYTKLCLTNAENSPISTDFSLKKMLDNASE